MGRPRAVRLGRWARWASPRAVGAWGRAACLRVVELLVEGLDAVEDLVLGDHVVVHGLARRLLPQPVRRVHDRVVEVELAHQQQPLQRSRARVAAAGQKAQHGADGAEWLLPEARAEALADDALHAAQDPLHLLLQQQQLHVPLQRVRKGQLVEHARARVAIRVDEDLITAEL